MSHLLIFTFISSSFSETNPNRILLLVLVPKRTQLSFTAQVRFTQQEKKKEETESSSPGLYNNFILLFFSFISIDRQKNVESQCLNCGGGKSSGGDLRTHQTTTYGKSTKNLCFLNSSGLSVPSCGLRTTL
ncbi:hypothetical protein L6164_031306 [Bauhinia variegata]|uniref:Uncharacterized protein n=1 Tax=Bauhinia variegata TaxID=167791 RepID=A0ACB9LF27_BAUVA|nr:hypothetical protein L6164_031306 [Bauhinia variegata]